MICPCDKSKMTSDTDNIKVKISEKYKPPPRINLVGTYAQRLKLNKQIQDNIPNYNFSMENYIIEKMKDWKEKKSLFLNQRQSSIEQKRQKLEAKKEVINDVKASSGAESLATVHNYPTTSSMSVEVCNVPSDMKYKIPNSSMLTPTQVSNNYSNILKPTQLQHFGKQLTSKEIDKKSSFNLSDFENDTSSPFDNMELKSINDLEELAQVLNQEDDQKLKTKATLYVQNNPQNVHINETQPSHLNYSDYLHGGYSVNQYLSNIPNIPSVRANDENFGYLNGCKYPTEFTQLNQQYAPYTWSKLNNDYMSFQLANVESNKSNCNSVPDLVNALEIELENSHISDTYSNASDKFKINSQESRPKSVKEVPTFHKKSQNEESLIKSMSKDEQDLCKSISIMGFPIERVARVYKLLGNDEKKIVEHLLAMSELLDLGFHEKDVSNALFECDNDRDKALDKLIT